MKVCGPGRGVFRLKKRKSQEGRVLIAKYLMNGDWILRSLNAILIAVLLFPCLGFAQEDQTQTEQPAEAPAAEQTLMVGPTAFVELQGARSSLGVITTLDINVGYQLTEHWSGDVGLPIFYVRSPHSLITNSDWETDTLLGDPYLDFRYSTTFSGLKFESVLTGTAPLSSPIRVFSTGRFGVDWFNHLEPKKSLRGVTPFLNLGGANQTVSRYYMPRPYSIGRPYQTLGFMGDVEGGLSFRFLKDYQVGGSFYALVPGGPQKMFSRIVVPGSGIVGDGSHYRYFDSAFETIGPSSIAKDNGYSGWAEITHFKNVDIQIGYTRSVHYHYDSASLAIKFNANELIKEVTGQTGK
jgi:hypothetical protein